MIKKYLLNKLSYLISLFTSLIFTVTLLFKNILLMRYNEYGLYGIIIFIIVSLFVFIIFFMIIFSIGLLGYIIYNKIKEKNNESLNN